MYGAVCKAENLKAAGISNEWHGAVHKCMQAARAFDELRTWLYHEVVGITEHKLHAQLIGDSCIERFERCIGTNRHKIRSINNTMRCMNPADACAGFF